MIIRGGKKKQSYLYPAGTGDLKELFTILMENAEANGENFRIHGMNEEGVKQIEEFFPGLFDFELLENYYDYIYLADKLRTLEGKKLHSKRNHINRFLENNPNWSYESITAENMDEVRTMSKEWCKQNDCKDDDALRSEACTVKSAIDHFDALGLKGGLLRVEGRVIAFTMGGRVSSDTFDVCIEKAFAEIQGAYPMINQQFVLHEMDGFTYVNREDDVGDEGLRKAKMSYYPEFLYRRYAAKLKKETQGTNQMEADIY